VSGMSGLVVRNVRSCPECPVGNWTHASVVLSDLSDLVSPVLSGLVSGTVRSTCPMVSGTAVRNVRKLSGNVRITVRNVRSGLKHREGCA